MVAWLGSAIADSESDYEAGAKAYQEDDLIGAMNYLERASDDGHAKAQLLLGYIYDKAEENELAMEYYRRAFDGGNAEAGFALGTMYASGDGVQRDKAQAREWFEKAAAAGHEPARTLLESLGEEDGKDGNQ